MPSIPIETNIVRIYSITRTCYSRDWSRFVVPPSLWNSVAKEKPFKLVYLDITNHYGLWACGSSYSTQILAERAIGYAYYNRGTALALLKVPLEKGKPIHYEIMENAIA